MEKLPGLNILERGLLGKFIPFPISPIIFQQMRTSFPVYHPGATPPLWVGRGKTLSSPGERSWQTGGCIGIWSGNGRKGAATQAGKTSIEDEILQDQWAGLEGQSSLFSALQIHKDRKLQGDRLQVQRDNSRNLGPHAAKATARELLWDQVWCAEHPAPPGDHHHHHLHERHHQGAGLLTGANPFHLCLSRSMCWGPSTAEDVE